MFRPAFGLVLVTACGGAPGTTNEPARPASEAEPASGTEVRVGPATGSSAAVAGGSVDPRLVHDALQPRVHAMRACYKKALAHDPKLGGEVRVRFVIDTEGRPTGAADAGSRLHNKDVVACVVAEISSVRFPKPEGGSAPVVYPIVFAPGD